jgi:putative flippase GtrA
MSVTELPRAGETAEASKAEDVDIVIPVHNEAEQLARSTAGLVSYLSGSFPFTAMITIVDNASTDGTWAIAAELAATRPAVRAIRLEQKGRGRALRAAWSTSPAAVVAYMDVDLATDLDALLPLVAPLISGHSDVAVGTRLAKGAHVVRGARREVISRAYNLLLRSVLRSSCTDAQCGFKALRRDTALRVLPLVEDENWFFDTEVIVTAQRLGLRIHEVPVHWVDDTDSRVQVLRTALEDLRGVRRLLGPGARRRIDPARRPPAPVDELRTVGAIGPLTRPGRATGPIRSSARGPEVFADELLRFAGVGALSTLVYAGLFAALRPSVGSFAANAVAIVLCSLGNTAVHRGLLSEAGHDFGRWRRYAAAGALLAVSLGFTTLALVVVRTAGFDATIPELVALTAANLAASFVRFGILRTWVFRPAFGANLAALSDHVAPAGSATDDPVAVAAASGGTR